MAAISFPQPYVPNLLLKEVTVSEANLKTLSLPEEVRFPSLVRLIPAGGIEQINGIDFSVVDNAVVWSELGLDGFIEAGDVILVFY